MFNLFFFAKFRGKMAHLFRKPHLVDFPFHLSTKLWSSSRKYEKFNQRSFTYLLSGSALIRRYLVQFLYLRTKLISDRSKVPCTLTETKLIINKIPNATCDYVYATNKLPKILLVYIDGLSSSLLWDDRVSFSFMPNLRKFFSQGRIYPNYYANAEWTLPNLASMMYGKLPSEHGLFISGSSFKESFVIPKTINLFQHLQAHGIASNVYSAVPYMNPNFGFHLGTDKFLYAKNRPFSLIKKLYFKYKDQGDGRTHSLFDALFLMDVHHSLERIEVENDVSRETLEIAATMTNLSAPDALNLYFRTSRLDTLLGSFLNTVESIYDFIVLVSDHGSSRLRRNPDLCLERARTNAAFAIRGSIPATLGIEKLYSPVVFPEIIAKLFNIDSPSSVWSVDDPVIFSQSIHPGQPFRLSIRDTSKVQYFSSTEWGSKGHSMCHQVREFVQKSELIMLNPNYTKKYFSEFNCSALLNRLTK